MAELDLAKGLRLVADLIGAVKDELFAYVDEQLQSVSDVQPSTYTEPKTHYTFEYDDDANRYIARGIYLCLPSTDTLIDILYQRQLKGLNSEQQKIGSYSSKSYITKEKADYAGLPWYVEGTRHNYSNYKHILHGGRAPKKAVDLNLTETMRNNYDDIHIVAKEGKYGVIFRSSVEYYPLLVQKYGETAFTLTIEEIGISWDKVDEQVAKILEKEIFG